ncbi:hypothetical protein HOO68_00870 [Candidatus Gracilibacteria bacterium]|nr:hypothetical protein [Candidatus Gracilibacteria bacterium]
MEFESESTSLGESSSISTSPEAVREKSEKQKESYKKAQAQIQRAQKDEKKAKGDNNELFHILTRFIQNPFYESLIPRLTELLSIALPSRPIIGILALVYPDAAYHVFHSIDQGDRMKSLQLLYRYEIPWNFNESELDESIRQWMSIWIESFDKYISTAGSSVIMQKKFLSMISNSEIIILGGITDFVYFFFQSRNIIISISTTESYARFILKNIQENLQKSLSQHPDIDILNREDITDSVLFGL